MTDNPKRRWFQFHLSSMMAVIAVLSMIIAANIPKEKHYNHAIFLDGSKSIVTTTGSYYHFAVVEVGWPMVIYGYNTPSEFNVGDYHTNFRALALIVDVLCGVAACSLAAIFTERLLYPKLLPIPGLEPVFDESKEQ